MEGKGKLQTTGKLGDVMQESAHAAMSYVRSRAQLLGLPRDFYRNLDIHVHVPEGAIPKDGPSAGITIATSICSALTNIPVRCDLAMTGEITVRGRVLPIGGLKEKVLAAHRQGIYELILPKDNEKDLPDIPENIRKEMSLHFVTSMDEVLKLALEREIVALPLAGTTPPVELVRGRAQNGFHIRHGRGMSATDRGPKTPPNQGPDGCRICNQCSAAGTVSSRNAPGNCVSGEEQRRQVEFAELSTGQQNGLAFTSAKPGCTQLINFYRIDGQFHFVDLPGYGYARVPKDIASQWKQLIEQYLLHRRSLELCFLILDARRGWMEKDLELKQWLEFHNRRYIVIATKTDKLKTQKDQRQGSGRHPEQFSGRRAPAVLGSDVPRSEGNLASDLDNQDPAAVAAPTEENRRLRPKERARTPKATGKPRTPSRAMLRRAVTNLPVKSSRRTSPKTKARRPKGIRSGSQGGRCRRSAASGPQAPRRQRRVKPIRRTARSTWWSSRI